MAYYETIKSFCITIGMTPISAGITAFFTIIAITIIRCMYKRLNKLKKDRKSLKTKITEKDSKISSLKEDNNKLEEKKNELLNGLSAIRSGKEDASKHLKELRTLLRLAQDYTEAIDYAILIKSPYDPETLIFLTLKGKKAEQTKNLSIPIKSNGQASIVFKTGQYSLYNKNNTTTKQPHYDETDRITGYNTNTMLSIPIQEKDKCIAILQLVNKKNNSAFTENDFLNVKRNLYEEITELVIKLNNDIRSLKILGIIEKPASINATIIFSDITNFSSSFRELSNKQLTEIVNDYFDKLCDICVCHGGTIENFLGDGFMVSFRTQHDHYHYVDVAVRSAIMMQEKFSVLKKEWERFGVELESVSNRIGIATGPIISEFMGNSSVCRSNMIMGHTVNVASRLCDDAHYSKNGILTCEKTKEKISADMQKTISFQKLEKENTLPSYEIEKKLDIPFYCKREHLP